MAQTHIHRLLDTEYTKFHIKEQKSALSQQKDNQVNKLNTNKIDIKAVTILDMTCKKRNNNSGKNIMH